MEIDKERGDAQGDEARHRGGKPVVPAEFGFKNHGHPDRKNVHDGERNQDVPAECMSWSNR